MYMKKISVAIISTFLFASSFSSFAADADIAVDNTKVQLQPGSTSSSDNSNETVKTQYFNFFGGTVKKISVSDNGNKFVLLESSDSKEVNMIITKDTYIVNGDTLAEGASVTGYYDANAPVIMIYPPQYNAEVLVVESREQLVKVDVFDKDLISSDNFLKLNLSETTEIVTKDGTAYKGELADKKLAVIYRTSSKSIPSQTTPIKVVVLTDKTETPGDIPGNISDLDIMVNGKKLPVPSAYVNEQGVVMVPLGTISEALGYKVSWDSKTKNIRLGQGISLTVGKDYYVYMRTAPITLGTAPVIKDNRTFVPLNFFTEVAKAESAMVTETQIIINN